MGILQSIGRFLGLSAAAGTPKRPGPADDYWYGPAGSRGGTAGMAVTPESSLRTSAVLACVRVIAETLASLPAITYRDKGGDEKERAKDEPIYSVLHDTPNNWQTAFEFWEMKLAHCALRGNAYSRIVPGPRGAVDQLLPLHPATVRPIRLQGGGIAYEWTQPDGQRARLARSEVFHIRWMTLDGLVGLSPIELSRQAVGLTIATETHGAKLFENGAIIGGAIEHPGKLSVAAAKQLRKDWQEVHSGPMNWHEVAVFWEGLKFHQIGTSARDTQFIESRKFQVEDIARIYRTPPHMIGALDRATNNNIEHQGIEAVQYLFRPWARRVEQAVHRDLFDDQQKQTLTFEFLLDALLRGDTKSRYEALGMAVGRPWMTVNEARRIENMPPQDGGDDLLSPLNMGNPGGTPRPPAVAAATPPVD